MLQITNNSENITMLDIAEKCDLRNRSDVIDINMSSINDVTCMLSRAGSVRCIALVLIR